MEPFAALPEQPEAKRLLAAALREGPAHAYLLHGPAGTGKRAAALAFAGEVLGDARRVEEGTHPDLYVLEALGEMIRIDAVRELRRDLHMRPFEADRRVYLILSAHLLNEDAADALLKDLEEPPPYAVILLVANELGPLPPTIRSRCQLVPFRRLSRARGPSVDRGQRRVSRTRRRWRWRASPRGGSTGAPAARARRRRGARASCSRSRAGPTRRPGSSRRRPRPSCSRRRVGGR